MAEYKRKKIERGSSRGRSSKVYKAPPLKEVIEQRDQELTDQYRERVNPDGSLLQIKGNLMGGEGSKINPDRQAKTPRQLEREKKLRQRAGSGQQGSEIAKKKLRPEERTDLPTFLQNRNALAITKKAAQATGAFATGASMLLIKSILNNPMGAY